MHVLKDKQIFKKKIFEFANGKEGNKVKLYELSEYLYDDKDYIATYCSDHSIDIDSEFSLKSDKLKKFYKMQVQPNMIMKPRKNWLSAQDYVADMTTKYRSRFNRARQKRGSIINECRN